VLLDQLPLRVEEEDDVVVGQRVPERRVPHLLILTLVVLRAAATPVVHLGIRPAGDVRGDHALGARETEVEIGISHDKISPCY